MSFVNKSKLDLAIDNYKQQDCSSAKVLLDLLYSGLSGYNIPSDEKIHYQSYTNSHTYGEILYFSANKLFESLQICENDVFYDLGSGIGKLILQCALTTNVQKACGIEMSNTRYLTAQKSLQTLLENNLKNANKCLFLNNDILAVDLNDATIAYMCSTCFPEKMMHSVVNKLAQCTNLRKLVSLKELPTNKYFTASAHLQLDMTWAKNVRVNIYDKL